MMNLFVLYYIILYFSIINTNYDYFKYMRILFFILLEFIPLMFAHDCGSDNID